MIPREVQDALDVSRETLERLECYVDQLLRWNSAINLIGELDRECIWHRHILDSAQLVRLAPLRAMTWLDLGSGAGLPGLVCAILCAEMRPTMKFTLVDSDARKIAFLQEAAHRLALSVRIVRARIENLDIGPQDIISARALASVDRLLEYAHRFCHDDTCLLLPKGSRCEEELIVARRRWQFHVERIRSISDSSGTILKVSELRLKT